MAKKSQLAIGREVILPSGQVGIFDSFIYNSKLCKIRVYSDDSYFPKWVHQKYSELRVTNILDGIEEGLF